MLFHYHPIDISPSIYWSFYTIRYSKSSAQSPSFELDPHFEVHLMQNLVEHKILRISCHVGLHVGLSSIHISLVPYALKL